VKRAQFTVEVAQHDDRLIGHAVFDPVARRRDIGGETRHLPDARPQQASFERGVFGVDIAGLGHGDRPVVAAANAVAIGEIAACFEHHHGCPPVFPLCTAARARFRSTRG
jgi:hypothetical protein